MEQDLLPEQEAAVARNRIAQVFPLIELQHNRLKSILRNLQELPPTEHLDLRTIGLGDLTPARKTRLFHAAALYYTNTNVCCRIYFQSPLFLEWGPIWTHISTKELIPHYNILKAKYNPTPELHLRVLETLVNNGCINDSSSQDWSGGSPLKILWYMLKRDREDSLSDIRFLLDKMGEFSWDDWGLAQQCISQVVYNNNVDGLRLLLDYGAKFHNLTITSFVNSLSYSLNARRVGWMEDKYPLWYTASIDILMMESMKYIWDFDHAQSQHIHATLRQLALNNFLTYSADAWEDDDKPEHGLMDLLFAKGHLAPSPAAIAIGAERKGFGFLFVIAHSCFKRGISITFPDLADNDPPPSNLSSRKRLLAGLLCDMVRRCDPACPASFLKTLDSINGGFEVPFKLPKLTQLCISAVRNRLLTPDFDETLVAHGPMLTTIAFQPQLVLPDEVTNIIPPALSRMIMLDDLHQQAIQSFAGQFTLRGPDFREELLSIAESVTDVVFA